jgi:hypothetical protein
MAVRSGGPEAVKGGIKIDYLGDGNLDRVWKENKQRSGQGRWLPVSLRVEKTIG